MSESLSHCLMQKAMQEELEHRSSADGVVQIHIHQLCSSIYLLGWVPTKQGRGRKADLDSQNEKD